MNSKGFTLIEILVGIMVFVVVFFAIISVFVFEIRLQRKSLAKQDSLDQVSFVMEYMSRALRVAIKDETGVCLSAGSNYSNYGNSSKIRFINHLQNDDCQEFYLEDQTLKYKKGIGSSESIYDLTAPNVLIENLEFSLIGETESDDIQPRVTMFLRANLEQFLSPINIQTTISQRNLDLTDN